MIFPSSIGKAVKYLTVKSSGVGVGVGDDGALELPELPELQALMHSQDSKIANIFFGRKPIPL